MAIQRSTTLVFFYDDKALFPVPGDTPGFYSRPAAICAAGIIFHAQREEGWDRERKERDREREHWLSKALEGYDPFTPSLYRRHDISKN
jgi:hypothetical protein